MDSTENSLGIAEKRRGPRFEVDQPVTVTNLEDRNRLAGKLTNFSTNGFRVLVESEMRTGSVVKVEWGSTMLLGEVIYCRREAMGFSLGMELEDALYDTEGFGRAAANSAKPPR